MWRPSWNEQEKITQVGVTVTLMQQRSEKRETWGSKEDEELNKEKEDYWA